MKFLKNISIKIKIISGFGLMQVIIVMIAASALLSLSTVQDDVSMITGEIQPAVLAVSELQSSLERANSSMGLYLLSQEEGYKEEYISSLMHVDEILGKLETLSTVKTNEEISNQLASIVEDVNRFKGYQETMLFLAENTADNIPATKFTTENLSPISVLLLQLANDMIDKESQQPTSAERRKLLLDFEIIRNGWSSVRYGLLNYLTYRQVLALREIKNARKDVEGAIDRLLSKKDLLTSEQQADLDQFVPLKDTFFLRLGEMIGIHGGEAWRTDAYLIRTEVGPLLKQVGDKVSALVNTFNNMIVKTSDELVVEVYGTNTLVTTMLIAGLLIGFIIGWAITKVIIYPLQEALNAMADIVGGEGDLTRRLDDSSKDEIGQLAHGFNMFASVVHHIVREIIGYTENLTRSTGRLAVVTEETSRGVDVQQAKTDEVVTAVNEMSATGEEVARNTTAAADAALHAEKASSEGQTVVGQTIHAINELADEVQRACSVINRLENDSNTIGGILDVIRGIAEQTNLLALNAAIEAARAGEQGRGFAVVADEVRTLASRTQESTAEIQDMIERLQHGAQEAVNVMGHSKQRTEQSVQQAQKAGEALESISEAVNIIKQMNVQIATAAEEQNAVGAEINRAVVEISEITDQTSAGTQQTASATNELNDLADRLAAMVKQFKV